MSTPTTTSHISTQSSVVKAGVQAQPNKTPPSSSSTTTAYITNAQHKAVASSSIPSTSTSSSKPLPSTTRPTTTSTTATTSSGKVGSGGGGGGPIPQAAVVPFHSIPPSAYSALLGQSQGHPRGTSATTTTGGATTTYLGGMGHMVSMPGHYFVGLVPQPNPPGVKIGNLPNNNNKNNFSSPLSQQQGLYAQLGMTGAGGGIGVPMTLTQVGAGGVGLGPGPGQGTGSGAAAAAAGLYLQNATLGYLKQQQLLMQQGAMLGLSLFPGFNPSQPLPLHSTSSSSTSSTTLNLEGDGEGGASGLGVGVNAGVYPGYGTTEDRLRSMIQTQTQTQTQTIAKRKRDSLENEAESLKTTKILMNPLSQNNVNKNITTTRQGQGQSQMGNIESKYSDEEEAEEGGNGLKIDENEENENENENEKKEEEVDYSSVEYHSSAKKSKIQNTTGPMNKYKKQTKTSSSTKTQIQNNLNINSNINSILHHNQFQSQSSMSSNQPILGNFENESDPLPPILIEQLKLSELGRVGPTKIYVSDEIEFMTKNLLFWRRGKKSQNDVMVTIKTKVDLRMFGQKMTCEAYCNGKQLGNRTAIFALNTGVSGPFQYQFSALFRGILPDLLSTKTLIELQFILPIRATEAIMSDRLPLVIYNHAKYKPCCQCMLIWYGPDGLSMDRQILVNDLLLKLAYYYNTTLSQPGMPRWLTLYLKKRLAVPESTTTVDFNYFYDKLGEWFAIALDMALDHGDHFWKKQPGDPSLGDKSFIPLLISRLEAIELLKVAHAEPGDFVIRVCTTVAEKQIRQARPKLKYPFVITVMNDKNDFVCVTVKEKEMLWADFIHGRSIFKRYVLFTYDGRFEKVAKERFAFNAIQANRLKETNFQTSVMPHGTGD
jgi:hypothetical protein